MDNIFQKKLLVLCLGLSTVGLSAPPLAKAAQTAYVEYYYEAGFYKRGFKVHNYKDNVRKKYITYRKSANYRLSKKRSILLVMVTVLPIRCIGKRSR